MDGQRYVGRQVVATIRVGDQGVGAHQAERMRKRGGSEVPRRRCVRI